MAGDRTREPRRRTPWWGLLSSATAPVLLIGGWTLAAARQDGGFDPRQETISALAALGADDRWVMTGALAGLGACHVCTALALRGLAPTGRTLLGMGGVATALVAALPLPEPDGSSPWHTGAAATAFGALAVWPLFAGRANASGLSSRPVSLAAGTVLLALVGWFAVELARNGDAVGLSERWAAGAQALWPMAVAWSASRARLSTSG